MKFRRIFLALVLSASAAQAQDLLKQFPVKGASAQKSGKSRSRKSFVAQEKVAIKGAFPIVKAGQLKGATAATNMAAAQKLIGKNATFVGVVTEVFVPRSGSIVLLNFAKDYKKAVVGMVQGSDFGKFPPLAALQGKKVALSGKVISYKGRPEVELVSVGSIRIVK